MDDRLIFKISLSIVLLGILLLLFLVEKIELKETQIADINKDYLDQKVKINGTITRITETKALTILDVKDYSGSIDVIVFEKGLGLAKNDLIEVQGKVSEYQGNMQLNAEKIKTL